MKDLLSWLCRTPQRLAAVVVVVLAVVLLGGGALFGGPIGGQPEDRPAAQQPVPTSAQVPDAAPFVATAVTFVQAWAQLRPAETADQWRARLEPLVTGSLHQALASTDVSGLPGAGVQGEPVVRFVARTSALIAVPLADGSSVLVTVVDEGADNRVSDVQPDVGDD